MKTPSKITNILLGIIAIMLIILVVVLIYKKRVSSPMMENPDPVHSASEKDIELLGISDKTVEFVHPPAEGKFSEDAVRNFAYTYNKESRIVTITANVTKRYFFEATAGFKVYDAKGNLVIQKGVTPTLPPNEDYMTYPNTHLPLTTTFAIPGNISQGDLLVVRFIADNASGLPEHDSYWGTTVRVN